VLTGVVILRQHISHFGILGAVLILGAAVYSEIELPRRKKTEN